MPGPGTGCHRQLLGGHTSALYGPGVCDAWGEARPLGCTAPLCTCCGTGPSASVPLALTADSPQPLSKLGAGQEPWGETPPLLPPTWLAGQGEALTPPPQPGLPFPAGRADVVSQGPRTFWQVSAGGWTPASLAKPVCLTQCARADPGRNPTHTFPAGDSQALGPGKTRAQPHTLAGNH